MIDFWNKFSTFLLLVQCSIATLVFHQELPDVWHRQDIARLQQQCRAGSCEGRQGNSFFNFNSLPANNGPFCFKFEWDDGSQLSWCQHLNPVQHWNISTAATDVFYTPKAQTTFESGDLVRFSGLFKSQNTNTLLDGNRGSDHQYGVGYATKFRGGYKARQIRNAARENSPAKKVNLYYQHRQPFPAHGYLCKHSGERLINSRLVTNPIYTCKGSNWTHWSNWSKCTHHCGIGGRKTRTRQCKASSCTGTKQEQRVCNTELCPLDLSKLGSCACDNDAFFCGASSHPQLKCQQHERCEKVSMDEKAKYRCVSQTLGECRAAGDPHVYTFDGAHIDVYGVAKYVFAQSNDKVEDVPDFKVIMETSAYGSASIAERAFLSFKSRDGQREYLVTTGRDGSATLTVDGTTVDLVDQVNESFEFRRYPHRVKITTWCGLQLEHHDWTITLRISALYQGNVEGLCGDYDMDKTDDFQKPDGTVIPCPGDNGYQVAQCELDCACSWIVNGDCGPGPSDLDLNCNKINECEALFNAPWLAECRAVVDPTNAINDCAIDLCLADNEVESKRQLLNDYVDQCRKAQSHGQSHAPAVGHQPAGAVCNWTTLSGLGNKCGNNEEWVGCADPCAHLTPCDQHKCALMEEQIGMCVCKSGYKLTNGKCIPEHQCPHAKADWSHWSPWSMCTVTCGTGTQTSSRFCLGPGQCEVENTSKTKACALEPCPVLNPSQGGIFGSFDCWWACDEKGGKCSACEDHFTELTGAYPLTGFCCSGADSKMHTNGDCTADMISTIKDSPYGHMAHHMCVFQKVDLYGPWSEWTSCSASCGGGNKSRDRECDGTNCAGPAHEDKVCSTHSCPIKIVQLSECKCQKDEWRCWSQHCDTQNERCELVDVDNNTYKCKPKVLGECKAWGDPHMISFDQQLIDVYGVGKYVFSTSESNPQTLPFYKIVMETSEWGEFSVVKESTITFNSRDGSTSYSILYTHDRAKITINGGTQFALEAQNNAQFSFTRVGQIMTLKTWFGLRLFRDGHTLSLSVPAIFMSQTRGLCGNYDQHKCDDWRHSDGTIPDCPCDNEDKAWSQCEKDCAMSWTTAMYRPAPDPARLTGPSDDVWALCLELLDAAYLGECNTLVDNTPFVKNCALDYTAKPDDETLMSVLSSFVGQCKTRLPDDEELTCNWLAKSGLMTGSCGANQIWKGCAKPCKDTFTCEDLIEGKTCAQTEQTVSMCICKSGYYLVDGRCVPANQCRVNTGEFSPWSDWSVCSVTCGAGVTSKSRICLGPGSCKSDQPTYKADVCDAGICLPEGDTCATFYENFVSFKETGRSFESAAGQIKDLKQFKQDGKDWDNVVSYVEIEPGCVFEAYREPNHAVLLGRWRGSKERKNMHEMDMVYENDKMSSYKCTCQKQTCEDHYTYNGALSHHIGGGCTLPECDKVKVDVCDSWKKKYGSRFKYGYALKITVDSEYWSSKGWHLIARFNGAHVNSGTFQIWNANFFNINRKANGLEVHIHQKTYIGNDLDDRNSFILVVERLTLGDLPEFYIWDKRQFNQNCFNYGLIRGEMTTFDRAIEMSEDVKSFEEVSYVHVSTGGNIRVKT